MPHKPLHDLSLLSSLAPLSFASPLLCSRNAKLLTVSQPYPTITFPYAFAHAVSSAWNIISLYYILSKITLINPLGPSFEFHTRVYNGSQRKIWKLLNTQNILFLWYWTHCLIIYVWLSEFFEGRYCFLSTFFTQVTSLTYRLIFLLFNYCHNDAM